MVSYDAVVLALVITSVTTELIELYHNCSVRKMAGLDNQGGNCEGDRIRRGIDHLDKNFKKGKWNKIKIPESIDRINNFTSENELDLKEKILGRKQRSPRPINVFSEVLDAWQWLNTPLTEEEERILDNISLGSPANQRDLDRLFSGFDGDSRITQTRNVKFSGKKRLNTREVPQSFDQFGNNSLENSTMLNEHLIVRKERSPRPIYVFNEILDAWQWLNTPISIEEMKILERMFSGSEATQEDLERLFSGFDGDSQITQIREVKFTTNSEEQYSELPRKLNQFTNSSSEKIRYFNENETQIIDQISSDASFPEEDLENIVIDLSNEDRFTGTQNEELTAKSQVKSREKRFIKAFITALINPYGRLPSDTRGVNVNSDANWTPRIPTVLSPHSGREQQSLNGGYSGSHSSSQYFNEYDSDANYSGSSSNFNEYSGKINNMFDESKVGLNKYFNEYNDGNGRIHQRWYDF